jgi:hypothetical protein
LFLAVHISASSRLIHGSLDGYQSAVRFVFPSSLFFDDWGRSRMWLCARRGAVTCELSALSRVLNAALFFGSSFLVSDRSLCDLYLT